MAIKNAVYNFLTKIEPQTVFVSGEKDLLVLPVMVFSPFKTLIFYRYRLDWAIMIEMGM